MGSDCHIEISQRPLKHLLEAARYILSTHKKIVTVRQEGIVLVIRGKRTLFCSEETGRLIGQKMLAFYNIEQPELLTVSDLNRENYFTVKRIELPALAATQEQFNVAHAQIKGHMAAAKTIYGNLSHRVVSTITRDNDHNEASQALGRFHNEAAAIHQAEQSATERKLARIKTQAVTLGSPVCPKIRNPDRVLDGQDWEQEVLERIARKNQPSQEPAKQP